MLRVAVVGLGWWGRIIAGLLKGSSKLTLARAVDVSPAAERFAREQGIAFSNSFESAITSPDVQAVILCTPHSQHCDQMVRAASGALGTLLQVEANFSQDKFLSLPPDNWRLSEKEAPAGPMTATGIHLLDLAIGLLGPAERVYARVKQLGSGLANGDTLGMLVTHQSGSNSLISAILATPFEGRFAVYGKAGTIRLQRPC